jgi:hypothetical protein
MDLTQAAIEGAKHVYVLSMTSLAFIFGLMPALATLELVL